MAMMQDECNPSGKNEVEAEKAAAAVGPMLSHESSDTIKIGSRVQVVVEEAIWRVDGLRIHQ